MKEFEEDKKSEPSKEIENKKATERLRPKNMYKKLTEDEIKKIKEEICKYKSGWWCEFEL